MIAGEVPTMFFFQVYDINIAASETVTDVVVSALNQIFPTKHLWEAKLTWAAKITGIERKILWRFHNLSLFGVLSVVITFRSSAHFLLSFLGPQAREQGGNCGRCKSSWGV